MNKLYVNLRCQRLHFLKFLVFWISKKRSNCVNPKISTDQKVKSKRHPNCFLAAFSKFLLTILSLIYMLMISIIITPIGGMVRKNFPPTKLKFYMRAISLTLMLYNYNKGIL